MEIEITWGEILITEKSSLGLSLGRASETLRARASVWTLGKGMVYILICIFKKETFKLLQRNSYYSCFTMSMADYKHFWEVSRVSDI